MTQENKPLSFPKPTLGVGVVVLNGTDVLLIKRSKPPRMGEWSLPGGRVEPGEPVKDAALREVMEETGLTVQLGPLLDVVDYIEPAQGDTPGFHYVLVDYVAYYRGDETIAGSDALEARFFPAEEALDMPRWAETQRIIKKALALTGQEERTS